MRKIFLCRILEKNGKLGMFFPFQMEILSKMNYTLMEVEGTKRKSTNCAKPNVFVHYSFFLPYNP